MTFTSNQLVPELYVNDFKKSLSFYTVILGFSIAYRREEDGFAFLTLGDAQLMIDQISDNKTWHTAEFKHPMGVGINFQIRVDSIAPLLERLKQNNIELFREVEEKWYRKDNSQVGHKEFLVQDPDGYLLRFFEDLEQRSVK